MNILERRRSSLSMKKFYNWFYRFYWIIEKSIRPIINDAIDDLYSENPGMKECTALEYACGTGELTLKLSDIFNNVEARDSSVKMLQKAADKFKKMEKPIILIEENILETNEAENSFDYVFISFALHLFSENEIQNILKKFLRIARKEVIVIDHSLKWFPLTAFVEWIEGSYYDKFIKLDFKKIADKCGAKNFILKEYKMCCLMRFLK